MGEKRQPWTIVADGDDPVVAAAIHAGHDLRDEIAELTALSAAERRREEDPGTAVWARRLAAHATVRRSRFEVDMNRPRDEAVYRRPEDAWGLDLWRQTPPDDVVARSLDLYDRFFDDLGRWLDAVAERHGRFVLLDLHSYNHRRAGPVGTPANVVDNPDVNLGTGSMPQRWRPIADSFLAAARRYAYPRRDLDVRENVRFTGGELAAWVHRRYPHSGCCLAVEVKKFYMNEWTDELDPEQLAAVGDLVVAVAQSLRTQIRESA